MLPRMRTTRWREVDADEHRAARAVEVGAGTQGAAVDDGEAGGEVVELDRAGPHEEGVCEERVPGGIGDHAHRQPVVAFGAGKAVEHVQVTIVQIPPRFAQQLLEKCRRAGLVHRAPAHVGGLGPVDYEAVLRGAAGGLSRLHDQSAVGGQDALAARQRARDQRGRCQVAVDRPGAADTQSVELRPDVRFSSDDCPHDVLPGFVPRGSCGHAAAGTHNRTRRRRDSPRCGLTGGLRTAGRQTPYTAMTARRW